MITLRKLNKFINTKNMKEKYATNSKYSSIPIQSSHFKSGKVHFQVSYLFGLEVEQDPP